MSIGPDVVRVVAPDGPLVPPGEARAVMVGDPADPAVQQAAAEMREELFGYRAAASATA